MFIKLENDSQYINELKYFNTENYVVLRTRDLKKILNEACRTILVYLEEFREVGGGWALQETIHLNVNISKYNPLRGNSYIPLPLNINRKNAVLNIIQNDRLCFVWSVLASMVKSYSANVCDYPQNYHEILNLKSIQLPMALKDVSKFENQNPNLKTYTYALGNIVSLILSNLGHVFRFRIVSRTADDAKAKRVYIFNGCELLPPSLPNSLT